MLPALRTSRRLTSSKLRVRSCHEFWGTALCSSHERTARCKNNPFKQALSNCNIHAIFPSHTQRGTHKSGHACLSGSKSEYSITSTASLIKHEARTLQTLLLAVSSRVSILQFQVPVSGCARSFLKQVTTRNTRPNVQSDKTFKHLTFV